METVVTAIPSSAAPLLPEWLGRPHPVVGMVHARPLPGAPRYDGNWAGVVASACADAETLAAGGVDGLMLENLGDTPFYPATVPAATVAALARLATEIVRRVPLPLGINVLRNDGCAALGIAATAGARFIRVNVLCGARVTDQGVLAGIAHDLLRLRAALRADDMRILADVDVKHSAPLAARPLGVETQDLVRRGGADGVIVSGAATGDSASLADLAEVRAAAGEASVWIGSGVRVASLEQFLPYCDGLIVGTSLKRDGDVRQPVELRRVEQLMAAVRRLS